MFSFISKVKKYTIIFNSNNLIKLILVYRISSNMFSDNCHWILIVYTNFIKGKYISNT